MSSNIVDFKEFLNHLKKMRVCVVYSYKGSEHPEDRWYDRWRTDVISAYGHAVEILDGVPLYCDADSLIRMLTFSNTKKIDLVINLNAGIRPISNWGLIPSLCSWLSIPVFPCSADTILIGERKDTTLLYAKSCNLPTPKEIDLENVDEFCGDRVVIKPRDLGGSVGISITSIKEARKNYRRTTEPFLAEEFFPGLDLTIPALYNPNNKSLDILPGILLSPNIEAPFYWINDEKNKRGMIDLPGSIDCTRMPMKIPKYISKPLLVMAEKIGALSICRFDLRVRTEGDINQPDSLIIKDYVFLEANPMPTIKRTTSMSEAVVAADLSNTLGNSADIFESVTKKRPRDEPVAYLLACGLYGLFYSQVK